MFYCVKQVRAQKFPDTGFFKLDRQKGNDLLLPKKAKKLEVIDLVLGRTCPEKYLKSAEKSGFVSL